MPYLRPGLTDLRQQALTDMVTAPGGTGVGAFRYAISRVISWALGYTAHGLYGHIDWVSKQSNPFTATGEFLEAWAAVKGVARKPALAWQGTARWSGSVPGTLLPNGSGAGQGGFIYSTTADATVAPDGTVTAPISAAQTGTAGGLAIGAPMSLTAGVGGINGSGIVVGITQPGVDLELDDPLRTRMLQVYAAPSQGGDAADYVNWALDVPGVTRAWANPLGMGAGTVVVYSMWDDVERAQIGFPQGSDGVATSETRGTPASGDQLVLANALYPLRPVTALVYSVAPRPYSINFVIHPKGPLISGGTVDLAVKAAIDGVFLAIADPLGTELETDQFQVAIAAVAGMPDFTMTAPAVPIAAPLGYLPARGAVTYA